MFLKSVTLKGFKSFPDRTRIEMGPGISVIVGPNGSGKSNITDAVLWAMGEQSPLAVRGASMQDVIFGGAPGRQAGRAAEVELVLDDSDGVLDLGTPEVSILRRLDRNGEGEYRIAGARCRLADVIELLSDTGLGRESHSVISQGRVESIITSKPRDRRLLIEEAAGLGKHRKRRRRAQLKLVRTQENLDRALDVEREARSRLRPLKRQAEAAELHARIERQALEIRWELSRDELRLRREAGARATAAATAARQATGAVEAELTGVAKRRERAEEALAARGRRREELGRRAYASGAAADRIAFRIEAVRGARGRIGERIARGREVLAALRLQAEADVVDPALEARLSDLGRELAALERDRAAELERQLAELEARRVTAAALAAGREAEVGARRAERDGAEAAVEIARTAAREAERAVEAARREAARVGGELASVNQFLRSHAGAPGGARALADELEVGDGYELALAAVLDGRLRAALVPDLAAAEALLARAGQDGGRTLVMDFVQGESRPGGEAPGGVPDPPCPGAERLADKLRGPADAVALARALLSDAWVVEALAAVPAGFAGTAVTRAGRVLAAAAGEVRQAAHSGEERVLAERNRRERLVAESEAKVQLEVAARAAQDAAREVLGGAEAERDEVIAAHRAAVAARDEAAEEQRRLGRLIDVRRRAPDDEDADAGRRSAIRAELAAERRLAERGARERAERDARIERLERTLARDERLPDAIDRMLAALGDVAAAVAERRAAFDATLAADRTAGEEVTAELRRCAAEEAALQGRLHEANAALTTAEVEAQRARDQAGEAEGELAGLAERLELEPTPAEAPLDPQAREGLQGRLEKLARRRDQLGPVNPLAQDEYAEALAHVEELERQRGDLETALRELESLIRDTDKQIRETFEQTFNAAATNFEELAAKVFPGGRGRLRLVSEREGPARVLGGQPAAGAGTGGEAAPGGEEVEDPELEDEAPTEDLDGVEIEITPAGKEMKRLTLLSGGEKSMTALAFLFSVFLARPCPFYILDEVEAALDDLNIDRFLALLAQYRERAQFIVVTHQKRTMEAADSLYGVSMGGDGISKVISRRLPRTAEPAGEPVTAAA